MKRNVIYLVFVSILLQFSCNEDDGGDYSSEDETVNGFRVVKLIGTAVGEPRMVPDIDGDGIEDEANCFDLTVIDALTGEIIGTGTDCLSNVTESGTGLALVGTAYFNFEDGTVVTRGLTSVQPKLHGSPEITHITGAIPTEGANDILSGTGIFEGATGSVRLSGAVNMSKVTSDNEITFGCVFIIPAPINKANIDPNIKVLRLVGTSVGQTRTVPDIDGDGTDDEGNCFDLDLIDVQTGEKIGTATDCLSNVTPTNDGVALVGTAIFNLPGGQIVTRGLTSVQPKTHGSLDKTHITGAIPPNVGANDIISGTGAYVNATGSVWLSGAVNMSKVASDNEITFNCLFVINTNN